MVSVLAARAEEPGSIVETRGRACGIGGGCASLNASRAGRAGKCSGGSPSEQRQLRVALVDRVERQPLIEIVAGQRGLVRQPPDVTELDHT